MLGALAANRRRSGGGGGAEPIDPLTLSPSAWYDPSEATSLFSDAGVTQAVASDPVQRMNDLSGNSRHMNQTTAGNRPTLTSVGGKPCLDFDGFSDFMAFTGLTLAQPLTFAAAVLIENASGSQGAIYFSTGSLCIMRADGSNNYLIHAGTSISGGTRDASPHTMIGVMNGASSALYIDGVSVASGNAGTAGLINGCYLGVANTEAGQRFDGKYFAGGIFPSALDAGQIAGIHAYLADKI